ncbi:MAG: oxidoreductase [Nitriliruptorales bacterium]|nr:oxidoreductase [Nitriliruptorales bacterium]
MSMFDRFRRRRAKPGGPGPSAQAQSRLKEFMTSREGVEAFVEPPTSVYAMSLCLVAADGEYLRQPVKDEKQAKRLCGEHGVPLYDARIVGYPKRMRDYERGVRQQRIGLEDLPPLDIIENPERD